VPLRRVLIANRGEIAIRIARATADLGIASVAVYSEDDRDALHVRRADGAVGLAGSGPPAYLDADQLVDAAVEAGCDAVHPGYGFLSESAAFAERCEAAGLVFVGPSPEVLALLGDKAAARRLAASEGIAVLAGLELDGSGSTGMQRNAVEEALAFLDRLGPGAEVMVKAVAGGGGRGMRRAGSPAELLMAIERCRSEATTAFGRGDLYVEQLLPRARHIEVQILGDGTDVVHLWERDCSLQRRHQKLVEIAPAPNLPPRVRQAVLDAAVHLGRAVGYRNAGTVELLVDTDGGLVFLEANARLQVEHTVTEAVTGVDLVQAQLRLAAGESLADLDLTVEAVPSPRGYAVQVRVSAETLRADGAVVPSTGTISTFEPPTGPGVRVDTAAAAGTTVSPRFDALVAKVVTSGETLDHALDRSGRALAELRVAGVSTNAALLAELVRRPEVAAGEATTRFVDEHLVELVGAAGTEPSGVWPDEVTGAGDGGRAGARVDTDDPLAVLHHGKAAAPASTRPSPRAGPSQPTVPSAPALAEGEVAVLAPMQGTVIEVAVQPGDLVRAGQAVVVMEAMKMEHVVAAEAPGVVVVVGVAPGVTIVEGHPLAVLSRRDVDLADAEAGEELDLDHVRGDLAEVLHRHEVGLDAARPDAVERRRTTGHRTARENVDDLCDPGTFIEYGPLVLAAQRRRRPLDDLIARTPADGLIAGIGTVNGDRFDDVDARCIVMSYDYTVLAGTQGQQNHRKKDRLFELAERLRLPVVFFTEGGGGRPGDTDAMGVAGLDCLAFALFGGLSGLVPLVGITTGRCFAGNAALLGCCDVIIATEGSNIGMGGPAMIEGGGLGVYRPEEVGPMSDQVPNGVVDLAVADEAEAVAVAKQYLSYFQGPLDAWECADQRRLRHALPENRLRVYDVRKVIADLADTGSVLELRRAFGVGIVTALARIEGRPVGVVANNPAHLGGAIDSDGADKAARFLQLCDAFDVPIVFLCDTPGMMVGPEVEKTALVRHCSRMFLVGASLTVPFVTVVLRKMYGLGGQAMAGGSTRAPVFTVAWPTSEFGGMGLEGSVKLGFRNELAAIEDPAERKATFERMVASAYEHGKGVNMASHFEIDDVIDPADTRRWIVRALRSAPPPARREHKKRPCIDAW
jgi:acetyl/propionyl-CoA carboxylase alpha subunit